MREHCLVALGVDGGRTPRRQLDASTTAEEEEEDEDDIDAVDPRVKQARKTGVSAFATADGFDEELSDARSGSRDELSQGGSREAVLPSQNGGGDRSRRGQSRCAQQLKRWRSRPNRRLSFERQRWTTLDEGHACLRAQSTTFRHGHSKSDRMVSENL